MKKTVAAGLAAMALDSGAHGVVCSPKEISLVRGAIGDDALVVTPGIRPESADIGDQKRVMTPLKAVEAGASYLVIGRPITQATDPIAVLAMIKKTKVSIYVL